MRKTYSALLFLKYFSTGIIVPVLSLMLIEKGCTLAEISITMGIYSLTVLLLELPSGILSDVIGRKKIFILSSVFNFAAMLAMLFLHGFAQLIPALILFGAGRAFSTGSLDALMIDEYIDKHGTEKLSHMTSILAILETVGISAGTIFGGFLPSVSASLFDSIGKYDLNIIARCVVSGSIVILSIILIKDSRPEKTERISIKEHLITSFRFLKGSRPMLLITLSLICSGFFIAIVEAYWQPAYTSLLPGSSLLWTIGIVSFGCFMFAAGGTLFSKRFVLFKQTGMPIKYTIARLLLFVMLIIFSFQKSALGFSGIFLAMYFIFAGSNVIENTMINIEVPSRLRSSMLSFVSLAFQLGCMLSPLYSSFMVSKTSIGNVFMILGVVLVPITLLIGIALARSFKNRHSQANTQ